MQSQRILLAIAHNPIYRFLKRTDFSIRGKGRSTFAIVKVQQYGTATGGLPRIDVAPAIAHHEGTGEVDPVMRLRIEEEAGQGLTAMAGVAIVMRADQELVHRKCLPHGVVKRVNRLEGSGTAGDVGLIGSDEQEEAERLQASQVAGSGLHNLHFFESGRRVRLAIAHDGLIENAVPIEEDGAHSRGQGFTDSHLVSARFRSGWETMRCHTTAWKASE